MAAHGRTCEAASTQYRENITNVISKVPVFYNTGSYKAPDNRAIVRPTIWLKDRYQATVADLPVSAPSSAGSSSSISPSSFVKVCSIIFTPFSRKGLQFSLRWVS